MSVKIGKLLAELKAGLARIYGPRLSGVFLFGSHARGEAEPGSEENAGENAGHFPYF